MAEARERRITTLNLDRKIYMVLVTPAGSREMLVLSETPGDALLSFIGQRRFLLRHPAAPADGSVRRHDDRR